MRTAKLFPHFFTVDAMDRLPRRIHNEDTKLKSDCQRHRYDPRIASIAR
jgi:hypothetical protein